MNKPIGLLISGKAESGKDSFADIFTKIAQENHYKCLKIKYGDFVKMVATTYYNWNGKKDEFGRRFITKIRNRIGKSK